MPWHQTMEREALWVAGFVNPKWLSTLTGHVRLWSVRQLAANFGRQGARQGQQGHSVFADRKRSAGRQTMAYRSIKRVVNFRSFPKVCKQNKRFIIYYYHVICLYCPPPPPPSALHTLRNFVSRVSQFRIILFAMCAAFCCQVDL